MKTLVIGIDGGDDRVFSGFNMPFYQQLKRELVSLPVVEDLWSRGWAEMLTGRHGSETGAFYQKPALDGTHEFIQQFGLRDIQANKNLLPLWQMVNERGYSVGFMNVPTTGPAPKVDGFLVSGAGGGVGKLDGVPDNLCEPTALAATLREMDYITDTRFIYSGIRDETQLFDRLTEMQEKRTDAFCKLAQERPVDLGFVAYMSTTRLQYLGMSEIESYLATASMGEISERGASTLSSFQVRLVEIYKRLDECLERLVNALQPGSIMLVSDHGTAPYKYKASVNPFLREIGALKLSLNQPFYGVVASMAGERISSGLRRRFRSIMPSLAEIYDWRKSYAFGNRYINGIYLNDTRFSGRVSMFESKSLVARLCEQFNATAEAKTYGMEAVPYRQKFTNNIINDYLPDIWIDRPDEIFFESGGESLVCENPNYGPIYDLNIVSRDIHTGVKGRHPLCMVSRDLTEPGEEETACDLSIVYRIIDRAFAK